MSDKKADDVGYKTIANDPKKSCINCKHFQNKEGEMGECFGHQVSSKATCNYFEPKK